LLFFGTLGLLVAIIAAGLAIPHSFLQDAVTPTEVSLCIAASVVLLGAGIVLGSLRRSRQELKRMMCLSIGSERPGVRPPSSMDVALLGPDGATRSPER
jgi:hypothetical protein